MAKRQRKLEEITDRVVMTCTQKTGQRIRRIAGKKNITISRLLAEIVEPALDELEAELDALGGDEK